MTNYKELVNTLSNSIDPAIIDLKRARKRSQPPTQAFSDFLSHNEQGKWAENLLYDALQNIDESLVAVKYGKSDEIMAGEDGFKTFYLQYQDELDEIGKRPDLLIFNKNDFDSSWGKDISCKDRAFLNEIVPKSKMAFEVRSSAYLTDKFVPKDDRPFLSFTPKVEDLIVVLKWINLFNVPHFYVQVFFDTIYILPFAKILQLLATSTITQKGIKNKKYYGSFDGNPAFAIEKNPKNQFKETIHIYLNQGIKISKYLTSPEPIGTRKELMNGRLLHYIKFSGGEVILDTDLFRGLKEKPY